MKILRQPPATHPYAPVKIAIVTGLSDPAHCRLSDSQKALLDSLSLPEEWKVRVNFPFIESRQSALSVRPPNLLTASVANSLQFTRSYTRRYAELARPHWQSLLNSAQQLLLITGSCGLRLAQAGIGPLPEWQRVSILSLGPVSFDSQTLSPVRIQGSRDWISKLFTTRPEISVPQLAHMGYWQNEIVREKVGEWLISNISESSAAATPYRSEG